MSAELMLEPTRPAFDSTVLVHFREAIERWHTKRRVISQLEKAAWARR